MKGVWYKKRQTQTTDKSKYSNFFFNVYYVLNFTFAIVYSAENHCHVCA